MRTVNSLMILATLSGCAGQAARNGLSDAQTGCGQGIAEACNALPYAQQRVNEETATNSKIALGIILLPLVILVAAAASQQPEYVIVCRWHCR